jgi:hypothetical protein
MLACFARNVIWTVACVTTMGCAARGGDSSFDAAAVRVLDSAIRSYSSCIEDSAEHNPFKIIEPAVVSVDSIRTLSSYIARYVDGTRERNRLVWLSFVADARRYWALAHLVALDTSDRWSLPGTRTHLGCGYTGYCCYDHRPAAHDAWDALQYWQVRLDRAGHMRTQSSGFEIQDYWVDSENWRFALGTDP